MTILWLGWRGLGRTVKKGDKKLIMTEGDGDKLEEDRPIIDANNYEEVANQFINGNPRLKEAQNIVLNFNKTYQALDDEWSATIKPFGREDKVTPQVKAKLDEITRKQNALEKQYIRSGQLIINEIQNHNGKTKQEAMAWAKSLNYDSSISPQHKKQIIKSLANVYLLTGGKGSETVTSITKTSDRAYAVPSAKLINVGRNRSITEIATVLTHEYGHHLESGLKKAEATGDKWNAKRSSQSNGKPTIKKGAEIGHTDATSEFYTDKFISEYVGKRYKNQGSTEVISMGLQNFTNPTTLVNFMSQDPDHFRLTLASIIGQ